MTIAKITMIMILIPCHMLSYRYYYQLYIISIIKVSMLVIILIMILIPCHMLFYRLCKWQRSDLGKPVIYRDYHENHQIHYQDNQNLSDQDELCCYVSRVEERSVAMDNGLSSLDIIVNIIVIVIIIIIMNFVIIFIRVIRIHQQNPFVICIIIAVQLSNSPGNPDDEIR